ncbi:NADPH:quinone reductase-like Zn-dependent oxidoreductase [Metapseudomonas resinovorans]|uniref:zinc-binding dehydrogenase n=1 Tax=Metapseudomonas resinovorans TaxID=53412 RepID=UPI003D232054
MYPTGQYVIEPNVPAMPGYEAAVTVAAVGPSVVGFAIGDAGLSTFEITQDQEKLERAKRFINEGLAAGQLRPVIDRTFGFDEMTEAHRYTESNAQVGTIVVALLRSFGFALAWPAWTSSIHPCRSNSVHPFNADIQEA